VGAAQPEDGEAAQHAFVASSSLVVGNTLLEKPVESLLGLALVALALPMFWYFRRVTAPRRLVE
jgi:hypothetical protein